MSIRVGQMNCVKESVACIDVIISPIIALTLKSCSDSGLEVEESQNSGTNYMSQFSFQVVFT